MHIMFYVSSPTIQLEQQLHALLQKDINGGQEPTSLQWHIDHFDKVFSYRMVFHVTWKQQSHTSGESKR